MIVANRELAWKKVMELMPNDYSQDMESSSRAGYPIYRSNVEHYDYICDLGNRLEVNLKEGNQTINIWIEIEKQGDSVEVTVFADSGETRTYDTYTDFRKDFRFFLSSGKRSIDNENHFEKIIKSLHEINQDGIKIETRRCGLTIIFTYDKWREIRNEKNH